MIGTRHESSLVLHSPTPASQLLKHRPIVQALVLGLTVKHIHSKPFRDLLHRDTSVAHDNFEIEFAASNLGESEYKQVYLLESCTYSL